MERIIKGDIEGSLKNVECIKNPVAQTLQESKIIELIDFGIGKEMIRRWNDKEDARVHAEYGFGMGELFAITKSNMERLKPDGITRLGLYIESLRNILHSKFVQGTVLDFGCGPWIDASLSFVLGSHFRIQLLDVSPLSLAFASYQLTRRGIEHIPSLVLDLSKELNQITDDVVMIIESSAFEHVRGLAQLFEPLMLKLPTGGLFLTNFTRLDWSQPYLDGIDANKQFVSQAIDIANNLAYRYQWDPAQNKGDGWDLWERK